MAQYIVGIDLGTSHTLLAYAPTDGSAPVALLPIAQRVSAAEIAAQPLLPSLRYQAGEGELAPDTWHQPWPPLYAEATAPALLGRYAQDLGAQVPGRLVSSAKSWLSHAGVDRTAPILPWGAPEGVTRISPLQASASYLAHLRAAWDAQFPEAPLAQQELVLTVPASFDEGARALTLEAAQLAGLPPLRLLEEPQAALHDWLQMQPEVGQALQGTHWLLVVDIGGGTTDLSLVQVTHSDGQPELARRGVGTHLMLGGDNMDLALAHGLEAELAAPQPKLSAARFAQLVQRCRVAKEQLLVPDAPQAVTVTLLGSGAQLLGGARSAPLRREAVRAQLLEGFFPLQPLDARPRQRQAGLLAWGLPYPADAAITRHLAAFLQSHADLLGAQGVPDSVLFNGGVFHGTAIAERVTEQLSQWRGAPVRVLANSHPDWAVARGAVAHGLARAPRRAGAAPGLRIGGGSARSYFLRLGDGDGLRAICILPQGSKEGVAVRLDDQRFSLRLGQAVRFHLLASTALGEVPAGAVRELAGEELVHLPPLSAVLPAPPGRERAQVEVHLQAVMTEVGTLQVQCVSTQDPGQTWPLEFALRGEASADVPPPARDAALERAIAQIDRVFGSHDQSVSAKDVRQLRSALEKTLGAREGWDLALLRTLFDALLARARRRRRTPEHERSWLNLAGYCLRPGVGAALDDWRIAQVWALYDQGIAHAQDSGNWAEWWIFWRRAAAGLAEPQQMQLLEDVAAQMQQAGQRAQGKGSALGSYDDMVRLFAVLENVPWAYRLEMGQWMLERLQKPGEPMQTWWALGRLCSRVPLGPAGTHQIIPPEQLDPFLAAVLAQDWRHNDSAMFAAVQMARMTGDRARDLSDAQRGPVLARLQQQRAPANWQAMVAGVVELDAVEQRRSFGESLPPGLVLLAAPASI
ncbi:MAG: Hsp70 family protein [Comamonas sp.]